jgi:radical SAM protein with 4Fe4S-binding SPASM domain
MTPEIYKKLGAFLLNVPTDKRHLRFAGGEPLLVFDIWEPFAKWMLEHKGTTIEVLTNLYLTSPEFFKFAELENVNISVSLDNGRKVKILDKSMVEKLKKLRNPWIMTTITKENVRNLDVLAAFIGMNNYGWALTTDYFELTSPPWEMTARALLKIVDILKEFNYDFKRISFNNFSVKSNFSGCRMGNEMFAVSPNGDFFRCQTQIEQGKPIGNVDKGYIPRKLSIRKGCESCPIFGLCTGWCPLHFKTPSPICKVIKIFANEIIREVKENAK